MSMQKKIIGISIVTFFVLGGFGIAWYTILNKPNISTGISSASLIYDPTDDRQVVGAYHNIFTGKVVQKLEKASYDAIPQTQYLVNVSYNIKGKLSGEVIISQLDGLMFTEGTEKIPVLQVGSAYLFATRENPDTGWNVLSPHPSGVKLLSDNKDLNAVQLLELSEQDQRVGELREAYKHEIIPSADLRSGNTRNPYVNPANNK